jgi:excisionase family DNA binding protein
MTAPARDPWSESFASPRVVAALFGVHKKLIYKLIERGELPHVRLGRAIRLPMRGVRLLVEKQLSGTWTPWKRRGRAKSDPA